MVDSKALWHQGLHSWRLWTATIAWKLLHVLHQYALFSTNCAYLEPAFATFPWVCMA